MRKKCFGLCILLSFLTCLFSFNTAGAVKAKFGVDTTISEMMEHEVWAEPGEAWVSQNTAFVSTTGEGKAYLGPDVIWDFGELTWDEVKDTIVRVTFNFDYVIEASGDGFTSVNIHIGHDTVFNDTVVAGNSSSYNREVTGVTYFEAGWNGGIHCLSGTNGGSFSGKLTINWVRIEFFIVQDQIIGTWSSGIWYRDVAKSKWTKMWSGVPSGDIAAGDFTGDGKADVASIWSSGLYYQNGATLGWTKVWSTAPDRIAAGDITGDGRDEIIGCGGDWGSNGVYYKDFAKGTWHHPWSGTPTGAIAAGEVTGDSKSDMVSCWSSGSSYQNGATLAWTKILSTAPYNVTCGDVTGDGRAEIIGTWSSGIWYWDVAKSKWTKMWSGVPSGEIAAGDFTGDGKADVASCWPGYGLYYQNGTTLGWTKILSTAPHQLTAGDVTGD